MKKPQEPTTPFPPYLPYWLDSKGKVCSDIQCRWRCRVTEDEEDPDADFAVPITLATLRRFSETYGIPLDKIEVYVDPTRAQLVISGNHVPAREEVGAALVQHRMATAEYEKKLVAHEAAMAEYKAALKAYFVWQSEQV